MKILGVAVKFNNIMVCMPKPSRHCDCFEYAALRLGIKSRIGSPADNQGFYTDTAEFLNRKEAWVVAEKEKQIINYDDGKGILFSENLW